MAETSKYGPDSLFHLKLFSALESTSLDFNFSKRVPSENRTGHSFYIIKRSPGSLVG